MREAMTKQYKVYTHQHDDNGSVLREGPEDNEGAEYHLGSNEHERGAVAKGPPREYENIFQALA